MGGVGSELACQLSNVRDLSKALAESLSSEHRKLRRHPYNRFAKDTHWWLVPSADWPAFEHGKLLIAPEADSQIFVGLHVERGYGPDAAKVRGEQSGIMNSDWVGANILRDMASGEIDRANTHIQAHTRHPVVVEIATDNGDKDPGAGPQSPSIRWEWDNGLLNLVRPNNLPHDVAGSLAEARTLMDVAAEVGANRRWEQCWMNMYFGVLLKPSPEGGLSADEIADQCLAPLLKWVR